MPKLSASSISFVAIDENGDTVAGAFLRVYEAGTTTPAACFSDEDFETPLTWPVVANAAGVFIPIYTTAGDYKVDISAPDTGASLPGYPEDNIHVSFPPADNIASFETRAEVEAADIPDSVNVIGFIHDGVYCVYNRSTTNWLRSGDGATWAPREGFAAYYQHAGLYTYETPASAHSAFDAMDGDAQTAQQAALELATLQAQGALVLDGYIVATDALLIGDKCELTLSGGVVGEALQGGFYITDDFNLDAEAALIGGTTGADSYAASVVSAHVQFDQSAAEATGDVADTIEYPPAFVGKEAFGKIGSMRVTSGWDGVKITAPDFGEDNDDNVGGWEVENLQLSTLNKDLDIENGFHFVKAGRVDSWVWGLGANLQAIRNREVETGIRREAITIGRCDSFIADHLGIFQGGQIVLDKGQVDVIADQFGAVQLDGDYASLKLGNGRTQIGRVYGTEDVAIPSEAYKVWCDNGVHRISDGSLVGDADALIHVSGEGVLTYSGEIRNTNNSGHGALVEGNGTLILENCHFVILDANWLVGFIEQRDTGTLVIKDCRASVRTVVDGVPVFTPIDVWELVKYTASNTGNYMDDYPRSRAQMVDAIAGTDEYKITLKGNRVYHLDGVTYRGNETAGAGTDLPGLELMGVSVGETGAAAVGSYEAFSDLASDESAGFFNEVDDGTVTFAAGRKYLRQSGATMFAGLPNFVAGDSPSIEHWSGGFTQDNVDAMAAAFGFIRVTTGQTVSEDVTVTMPLHFTEGAFLSVNSGRAVDIQADVETSPQWVFRGDGDVSLSHGGTSGEEARKCEVSWFGAFPGDATVDAAPFLQKAADAMGTTREGEILFDVGTYYPQSKVTWSRANRLIGRGDRMTNIWPKGALATSGDVWDTAGDGVEVRGFQFNSDSARTSGAYVRLLHNRCEAYDIYIDKAHEGVVLEGNECKAYRCKGLTSGGGAGSSVVSVAAPRCVVDGVDFTTFSGDDPESLVRVNAQSGSVETCAIRNLTGDTAAIGVLIEIADGETAQNITIDGVAVETATDCVKFELSGSGAADNVAVSNLVASDGGRGFNADLAGSGNLTNLSLNGITGEGASDSLFRVSNVSTGILDGATITGLAGGGITNGVYIGGTGSPHANVSGSALSITGGADGLELNVTSSVFTGVLTDATTGVRLASGCENVTIEGKYTGAGAGVVNAATATTNRVFLSQNDHHEARSDFIDALGDFVAPRGATITSGGETYIFDGSTGISDAPGWNAYGERSVKHHGAAGDFDWSAKTGTDDTDAIREAAATGDNFTFPDALFRVTGEIELVTPGQVVKFEGKGTAYGEDVGENWQGRTGLVATGTWTPRIRTRRLFRGSSSDPQDDPISCVLNVQAEGVRIEYPAIHLWVDYTTDLDGGSPNLGDDCDVAIFVGSRVHVSVIGPTISGYFRRAGIYNDVTQSADLPRCLDLAGNPYPDGSVKHGGDGAYFTTPYIRGPRIGFCVLGASPEIGQSDYGSDYYDEQTGGTVPDARGSFGFSDLFVEQGRIYGPDHHSSRRLLDPNGGAGSLSEVTMEAEPDTAPAAMFIDGLAGNSSGSIWGMRFIGTRFATFEAFRVRLGRTAREMFIGCHIEGRNASRLDTSGNPIDTNDYTDQTYGSIAGTDATASVSVYGGSASTLDSLSPHFYASRRPLLINDAGRILNFDYAQSDNDDLDLRADNGHRVRFRTGSTTVGFIDETGADMAGGAFLSGESSVSDNAAITVTCPTDGGGTLTLNVMGSSGSHMQLIYSGSLTLDTAPSVGGRINHGGANLAFVASDVTGSTGTSGDLTVGVIDGAARIENQTGQTQVVRYHWT